MRIFTNRFTRSAVAVCLLLAAGCGTKEDRGAGGGGEEIASNVSEVVSVQPRPDAAPEFTWKDASGAQVSFDAFRGKVTVVNFWATWCVPCKKELPDLVALSGELAGKGVKFIGVSTDRGDVTSEVSAFVKEFNIPYQIVIGNEDIETAFNNVRMMPTTFIINADGKIVETLVGIRTKEFLLNTINSHL